MADSQSTSHDKPIVQMPWGLHLLSDHTSEARQGGVVVDIIAVHGLGANPDHAWVRHKNTTAGPDKDVRWLTDLLPQTFRDFEPSISARIFCFNYQSAWLGPQLSRNRLEGLAGRLLDDVHNGRGKSGTVSDRPLIFIGHSFGGLVIEQAVVQANSAGGRYEYLIKLIGGVVLLGTPHQGSKSQKWGSILANLARLIDYGETGLMEEVDEKSMKIFDLISEFKKIMISIDLAKTAVICFYENHPTNYLSRVIKTGPWLQGQTSSVVVEETSAVLSGFYSIVLDSDHLELSKFASPQDGNYMSVSSNLCRIAAAAPENFRSRRKGTASSQDKYFLVSRERVKDFIGRDNLLDQIWSHFSRDQTGPPPRLILHALGGQGKSQIALEYCRKWRETYRGVFWINANSEMTVTQSYATIAAELSGGSLHGTDDSAALIKVVKERLEHWSEAWLLVFDNYDEPERFPVIRQFIPTKGHGHVLFTSRNRDLSRLGTLLEIPPMAADEAVRLLLRGYDINDIQQAHHDAALRIVNRLGQLALAIDQAAAYIKYKRMPLDRLGDFLTTYEAERRRILSYTPKILWEYRKMQSQGQTEPISAFTTWEMSFQQLGSGDEPWKKVEAHFLTLSAFFAPTSITESLFRYYHERYGGKVEWIQKFSLADGDEGDEEDEKSGMLSSGGGTHGTWDSDRYWDIVDKSAELSLLQSVSTGTGQQGASFSLHPLIRDWLQLRLKGKERQKYTQEAIEVLACCAKAYRIRSTSLEERTALITHMDVSLSNDEEILEPQNRLGCNVANRKAAGWLASFYAHEGRYRTSESLFRRLVETLKSKLSEEHPSTLLNMRKLAMILGKNGKYEEADSIHRQTLRLMKKVLGENHVDTLITMHNLASLLSERLKFEEAEPLYRQTIKLRETELGSQHPDTLSSISILTGILRNRKKYEEAEELCRSTLLTQGTVMGKEHPLTLSTMNNLAAVLQSQKKYDEAEQICRSVLMKQETVLGKEHPNTMTTMGNLVALLLDQKRYDEAERMGRQTLMMRDTVLGQEHPGTLDSVNVLAVLLIHQNKYEEAERLYRQALMLREKVSGKEHPDTLLGMKNMAYTLMRQGKYDEAERLYRQALMLREKVSGKEHLDTLSSMENMACSLMGQGKYDEAERLYRQVLMLREKVSGKEHPDTLLGMENVIYSLTGQGKYDEAERMGRQALMLREKVSGKEHPDTLLGMENVIYSLTGQGKYKEAERTFEWGDEAEGRGSGERRDEGDGNERLRPRITGVMARKLPLSSKLSPHYKGRRRNTM